MSYAEVADLEARWRSLSPEESGRATVLLADAAVRIDVACPPGDEPLTEAQEEARMIVSCEMVKRAMSASEGMFGVTSYSDNTGPFQEQRTFANPMGDLYLTKGDKALLGCGGQVAFSVPMHEPPTFRWPWEVCD